MKRKRSTNTNANAAGAGAQPATNLAPTSKTSKQTADMPRKYRAVLAYQKAKEVTPEKRSVGKKSVLPRMYYLTRVPTILFLPWLTFPMSCRTAGEHSRFYSKLSHSLSHSPYQPGETLGQFNR